MLGTAGHPRSNLILQHQESSQRYLPFLQPGPCRNVKACCQKAVLSSSTLTRPQTPGTSDEQAAKEVLHSSTAVAKDNEQEKFQWRKAWYPVAIEAHLPKDRPTAIRLLGEPLVLWKDGDKQWRAFQDLCPHRMAPLSEGRVENGTIVCSYHGWAFEGSGACSKIPQADNETMMQKASRSSRACVKHYPCKVIGDLVWVFGSGGSQAVKDSEDNPPTDIPELLQDNIIHFPFFSRDLPYGTTILSENVVDPSHVPHSHHGVQGNRFKPNKLHMKPAESIDVQKGFSVQMYETGKEDDPSTTIFFRPPCLIQYKFKNGGQLISYATPTDPGRCRIFFTVAINASKLSKMAKLIFKVMGNRWLDWKSHLTRNNVLDGDNVFLAMQEEKLRTRDQKGWANHYYTPASLDSGVRALNTWLAKCASSIPWGPEAIPAAHTASMGREQMLDRFHSHTKNCPSCSAAHATFSKLRWVAGAAAVLCSLIFWQSLQSGFQFKRLVLPFLGIIVSALTSVQSQRYKQLMEFKDYRHPDH